MQKSIVSYLFVVIGLLLVHTGADQAFAQTTAPIASIDAVKVPVYITVEEVQRVCKELGLRDWTAMKDGKVTPEEARLLAGIVGAEAAKIPLTEFQKGLEIELEHGIQFPDANVTNNHPILTGKIVLAHLKETLDYYLRLHLMELEAEMLEEYKKGNMPAFAEAYDEMLRARAVLAAREKQDLKKVKD